MKKLSCLALALLLSVGTASAADIKASGFWDISGTWADTSFSHNNTQDRFSAAQRLRAKIEIIANENLKGVVQFESDSNWGVMNNGGWSKGGALGTDGFDVKVKSSFVDWVIPNTSISVRMGLQPVILPGFVAGSNVFDDDIAGITVSTQLTDNVGLVLAWGRAFNDNNLAQVKNPKDTADSVTLVVPLTFEGVSISPWVTYARGGRDTDAFRIREGGEIVGYGAPQLMPAVWGKPVDWADGRAANIVWAGLTGEVTLLDPLRLAFDFNYGNIQGVAKQLDRSGWFLSALAEYKLDWATPGIMAWYGSGDDSNINNGSERMPTFSASWTGTSFGWDGYYSSRGDGAGVMGSENVGNWGVALYLADISFVEKLKHKLLVSRYQGTNSNEMARYISGNLSGFPGPGDRSWDNHTSNGIYLTKKDSVWEVNLNNTYAIYDNLELSVEFGYMNLDLDKANWGVSSYERNAYRADITFHYAF